MIKSTIIAVGGVALVTALTFSSAPVLEIGKEFRDDVQVNKIDGLAHVELASKNIVPVTNLEIGEAEARSVGWTGSEWSCLVKLWTGESNWRTEAYNPSGAGGIPQALPMSKMASVGADYKTNPTTQIKWGLGYIRDRYQTPCNALSFWNSQSPHWY